MRLERNSLSKMCEQKLRPVVLLYILWVNVWPKNSYVTILRARATKVGVKRHYTLIVCKRDNGLFHWVKGFTLSFLAPLVLDQPIPPPLAGAGIEITAIIEYIRNNYRRSWTGSGILGRRKKGYSPWWTKATVRGKTQTLRICFKQRTTKRRIRQAKAEQ